MRSWLMPKDSTPFTNAHKLLNEVAFDLIVSCRRAGTFNCWLCCVYVVSKATETGDEKCIKTTWLNMLDLFQVLLAHKRQYTISLEVTSRQMRFYKESEVCGIVVLLNRKSFGAYAVWCTCHAPQLPPTNILPPQSHTQIHSELRAEV